MNITKKDIQSVKDKYESIEDIKKIVQTVTVK